MAGGSRGGRSDRWCLRPTEAGGRRHRRPGRRPHCGRARDRPREHPLHAAPRGTAIMTLYLVNHFSTLDLVLLIVGGATALSIIVSVVIHKILPNLADS